MKKHLVNPFAPLSYSFFICALFTLFVACSKDEKNEPSPANDIVGEYTGTFTLASNETTNVKVVIEKVDNKTVIVRPQVAGATAFRATVTTTGTQGAVFDWTTSETSGHALTGSLAGLYQSTSKSLQYIGQVTVSGQTQYENFEGNKK